MKCIWVLQRSQRCQILLAEPTCGVDFCDTCGDCLFCYANERCSEDQEEHRWVRYYLPPSIFRAKPARHPDPRHRNREL